MVLPLRFPHNLYLYRLKKKDLFEELEQPRTSYSIRPDRVKYPDQVDPVKEKAIKKRVAEIRTQISKELGKYQRFITPKDIENLGFGDAFQSLGHELSFEQGSSRPLKKGNHKYLKYPENVNLEELNNSKLIYRK